MKTNRTILGNTVMVVLLVKERRNNPQLSEKISSVFVHLSASTRTI